MEPRSSVRILRLPEEDLPSPLYLFKMIGSETSIGQWMNDRVRRRTNNGVQSPRTDWNALYMQFNSAHCLGTVSYRFDVAFSVATLLRVTLNVSSGISVLVVDDVDCLIMSNSSVAGVDKATILKSILGIDSHLLLMDELGKRNALLMCRETEQEWECVIPESLVCDELLGDEQIVRYYKPEHGMLAYQRDPEDGACWTRLDYLDVEKMTNEPPDWIVKHVMTHQ